MDHKGILALDIDNTLTDASHVVPQKVADTLADMQARGWYVFVLTGRSFTFAMHALERFSFPYYLCTQNGAEGVTMPQKDPLFTHHIDKAQLQAVMDITNPLGIECFIYSGYRLGDFCFYRKEGLSEELLDLAKIMQRFASQPWQAFTSIEDIAATSFPLVKCIAPKPILEQARQALTQNPDFNLNILSDVFKMHLSVLLVTHSTASKGQALERVKNHLNTRLPVVAAGDDENDISLLHRADVKIAMGNGHPRLQEMADIVAKPSVEYGIIEALQQAEAQLAH